MKCLTVLTIENATGDTMLFGTHIEIVIMFQITL